MFWATGIQPWHGAYAEHVVARSKPKGFAGGATYVRPAGWGIVPRPLTPNVRSEKMNMNQALSLSWRLPSALLITAVISIGLMRFAGGAAMFCIDPPAADPGWEWKVPLAWVIIYGLSSFIGIAVGTFRSRKLTIPVVVTLVTICAFIILRFRAHNPACPYFDQKEALFGIPAMVVASIAAYIMTFKTRKTEHSPAP